MFARITYWFSVFTDLLVFVSLFVFRIFGSGSLLCKCSSSISVCTEDGGQSVDTSLSSLCACAPGSPSSSSCDSRVSGSPALTVSGSSRNGRGRSISREIASFNSKINDRRFRCCEACSFGASKLLAIMSLCDYLDAFKEIDMLGVSGVIIDMFLKKPEKSPQNSSVFSLLTSDIVEMRNIDINVSTGSSCIFNNGEDESNKRVSYPIMHARRLARAMIKANESMDDELSVKSKKYIMFFTLFMRLFLCFFQRRYVHGSLATGSDNICSRRLFSVIDDVLSSSTKGSRYRPSPRKGGSIMSSRHPHRLFDSIAHVIRTIFISDRTFMLCIIRRFNRLRGTRTNLTRTYRSALHRIFYLSACNCFLKSTNGVAALSISADSPVEIDLKKIGFDLRKGQDVTVNLQTIFYELKSKTKMKDLSIREKDGKIIMCIGRDSLNIGDAGVDLCMVGKHSYPQISYLSVDERRFFERFTLAAFVLQRLIVTDYITGFDLDVTLKTVTSGLLRTNEGDGESIISDECDILMSFLSACHFNSECSFVLSVPHMLSLIGDILNAVDFDCGDFHELHGRVLKFISDVNDDDGGCDSHSRAEHFEDRIDPLSILDVGTWEVFHHDANSDESSLSSSVMNAGDDRLGAEVESDGSLKCEKPGTVFTNGSDAVLGRADFPNDGGDFPVNLSCSSVPSEELSALQNDDFSKLVDESDNPDKKGDIVGCLFSGSDDSGFIEASALPSEESDDKNSKLNEYQNEVESDLEVEDNMKYLLLKNRNFVLSVCAFVIAFVIALNSLFIVLTSTSRR